ncbi:SAF domain-containing protein [Nitritalea halalkaliphila]|uniref:SAF domain-containing protein n=1 Tax=Nitritalea halalkaliphila TaxID=590849 RepID=UPI000A024030
MFPQSYLPSRDISEGEILNEENLTILRPCVGIDARDFDKLIGRKTLRSFKRHEALDWNFIQE